jgi:hypothetical protein
VGKSSGSGDKGPIARTFPFAVKASEKAKAFWNHLRDGDVLSGDCFVNEEPNYTLLHVDDYGAAPVGQLEGHGGFKIWFVFSPTVGKHLVGQDEFHSGTPWFRAISRVATEALNHGWVFVQLPGNTVFIPPNFYHSVLTVPEGTMGMELFLIGETRMHPEKKIAYANACAWITNYSRGDHNGHRRGDKDGKWEQLKELFERAEIPATAGKKRLKTNK